MQGRFFLNVVVGQGSAVFQLFTSEDQSLLIRGNTFFVLDFRFDIFNSVRRFNFQSDSLSSQSLDKNLHTTSQSKNQVKGGFFLDVVVRQGSAVFQLFTSEDQSLLIRRDTFFVLDFGLDVFNGIRGFDLQGDGLTGEGFDEDLHV